MEIIRVFRRLWTSLDNIYTVSLSANSKSYDRIVVVTKSSNRVLPMVCQWTWSKLMTVDTDIQLLRERRFKVLKLVYDKTGGDESKTARLTQIADELGLTDVEVKIAYQYLRGEGLLEYVAMGSIIRITHFGVSEVENALSNPDQPTEYFPPINVINIHHMQDSNIQQGTTSSVQANVDSPDLEGLKEFLALVRKRSPELGLGPDARSELEADLASAESQANSTNPKATILRECLQSIKNILESAAGLAVAQQLLPLLPPLIAILSGL